MPGWEGFVGGSGNNGTNIVRFDAFPPSAIPNVSRSRTVVDTRAIDPAVFSEDRVAMHLHPSGNL